MLNPVRTCIYMLLQLALLAPMTALAQDPVRDADMRSTFQRQVPCPANQRSIGPCPGYEVIYIRHPCSGGSRTVGNLKWQELVPVRPGQVSKSEDASAPQTITTVAPCT